MLDLDFGNENDLDREAIEFSKRMDNSLVINGFPLLADEFDFTFLDVFFKVSENVRKFH